MQNQTILANLKTAARNGETVKIAGGYFGPAELRALVAAYPAPLALTAADVLALCGRVLELEAACFSGPAGQEELRADYRPALRALEAAESALSHAATALRTLEAAGQEVAP